MSTYQRNKKFLGDTPISFLEKYTLQDIMNLVAAGRTYAIWALTGHSISSASTDSAITKGRHDEMEQMIKDFNK